MPVSERIEFEMLDTLRQVAAAEWDGLHDGHPALNHAFLNALEQAGCVGGDSGWLPRYLVGRSAGRAVAALPLFLKMHSYGEYVFDWAWADAYQRHGLDYYPKWLVASPFSPLPGMRLLGHGEGRRRAALRAALQLAEDSGLSSLHLLFVTPEERDWLRQAGLLLREGVQFHWRNHGDASFADFLSRLNHDKRKKIRQERRRVADYGLDYRWLDGSTASAADWAFLARCYAATYRAHRSTPYLNGEFFTLLAAAMPGSLRLLLAMKAGKPVASAFFLYRPDALYGRYWGTLEALPGLHFELCYYRPIEYCIAHSIARMEGGAQGEHKLSRGLEAVPTCSAHWIADPRFRDAIDRHLALEGEQLIGYRDELEARSPFKRP